MLGKPGGRLLQLSFDKTAENRVPGDTENRKDTEKLFMMKRFLSILLALIILLGLSVSVFADRETKLPKTGETVYGFTLKETRAFPLAGAQVLFFTHDRTGAQLLYIANSDTNRVFDLTFMTTPENSKGVPHVLEHAVLKGSEKYPSSGLWFNLLYQTYNTYMNAETGPLYTTYPVASLSEAQLLRYADFYTDSCLHPRVLEDESIFREEAWRYRLENKEDLLTIEGTVYSEMQAASDLYQTSYYQMLRTAFPGSVTGNVSGGDPEQIPEMTWEDLKAYHAQYYHPSNCVVSLYGKFDDYGAFLKLLDEAFSDYDRQEFRFEDSSWEPISGDVEKTFRFPTELGSDDENAASLYYVFLCPNLKENQQEEMVLNTLTDLMAADASPVTRCLREVLPAAFLSTWISMGTPEDAIIFNITGVDSKDAQTARDAIDKGLQEIAENGFSQELVDAMSASLNMNMRLSCENTALGLSLLTTQMIPYYAETGRIFDSLDYVEALRKLDEWNREGIYSRVVSDWLLGCTEHVLTVTSPEPGLREKLDEAEAERLIEVKATMSEDELAVIVERTNSEDTDADEDNAAGFVKELKAVTVESLPEELRQYDILEETGDNGVRYVSAKAEVDGVGMPVILLDAAGVPQEDLHWFVLYLSLLGELDTARHTKDELQELTSRYLYGGEFRQSLMDEYGTENYHPYLRAAWLSTDEDLETGYELLYELLFETDLTDTEAIAGLLERNCTGMKNLLTYSAYDSMRYRALGAESPLYAYYNWCNGLDYYTFLEEAAVNLENDPDTVIGKLQEMQNRFCNRCNAIAVFAGEESMVDHNRKLADRFFGKLGQETIEPVRYSFEAPAMREALVIDDTVQYNGLVGSYKNMGLEEYTSDLDAVAALVTDLYLIPQLREEYGVYTPIHNYDSFAGGYLLSYRDPNIEETFAVYDEIGGLLKAGESDQDTLDGYILSCYSAYAMPEGELSGAITAIMSRLCGEPENLKIRHMEELKSLTPEKLQEYAGAYEKLAENGRRFTVGSESAISESAELFDVILRPFSEQQ